MNEAVLDRCPECRHEHLMDDPCPVNCGCSLAAPSEEYLRGARALLTGLIWGERDA